MQCPNFLKPALRNHKISQPNSHIKIQNNNKNPQIPKILQHSIVRRKRKQTQLIQSSELEKTAGNNF